LRLRERERKREEKTDIKREIKDKETQIERVKLIKGSSLNFIPG